MGKPMIMGGAKFDHGLGMHAHGSILFDLGSEGLRFQATVGKDDEQIGVHNSQPIQFIVYGDNDMLWQSGPMQAGDQPLDVDLDISGFAALHLVMESTGYDSRGAIGNWADARIEMKTGELFPFTFEDKRGSHTLREWELTTAENAAPSVNVTPEPASRPRINSPRVFGIRPGSPLLYKIATSGLKPFKYHTDCLPPGVKLDGETGQLNGTVDKPGNYHISLSAANDHGADEIALELKVGDTVALTPPMGWESWNCWGPLIDDAKVRDAARMLVETGLIEHGWNYVIIDDGWQGPRSPVTKALTGNEKFPDMQGLCDYIHRLGLKVGIYSTPWVTSFMNLPGGSADTPEGKTLKKRRDFGVYSFHREDAEQFARWGVDLLKYDWSAEIPHALAMGEALKAQHRDIVYSISGAVKFSESEAFARVANYWRTNPDIVDNWQSVYTRAFYHYRRRGFQRPGAWNDPDMMVIGVMSWGKGQRPCKLTPDEQYTHVSMWALFAAPMLLGCDLTQLDPFTMSLITNDDIIAINQDPRGIQAARIYNTIEGAHAYAKPLFDGSMAIGLFNTAAKPQTVRCGWEQLGIEGEKQVGMARRGCT